MKLRATRLDPKKASVLLLLVFQCVLGTILLCHRGCEPNHARQLSQSVAPTNVIYVHVVGNVKAPGVYKFPATSSPTRQDAVIAAGGLLEPGVVKDASSPIHDEEQVLIESSPPSEALLR